MALAKISGRDLIEVVKSEIGAMLNRTIDLTYSSSEEKLDAEFEAAEYTSQPPSLYIPQTQGGLKRRASANLYNGKLRYDLSGRYPDQLWNAILAARTKSLIKKKRAIGLAKKSWWEIGRALGLNVKGGRFTRAIATTGRDYPEDYATTKDVKDGEISMMFINAQPTVNSLSVKGAGALQAAINGRVQYFNRNMRLGVFRSMENIAKRYPGLKITTQ
jgi:hypothetical protein